MDVSVYSVMLHAVQLLSNQVTFTFNHTLGIIFQNPQKTHIKRHLKVHLFSQVDLSDHDTI